MSRINNSQAFALFLTLLFCFFAVPVFAQEVAPADGGNSTSIVGKLGEYAIKIAKWGWNLITKNYRQVWDFFVKNIWPITVKVGKAIFNALFNKDAAATA